MRIFQAISVFFKMLFDREFAERLRQLPASERLPNVVGEEATPQAAPPLPGKKPGRSDAITLLATLQREARFVDIVMEPLGEYSDAQVGAATRDVLSGCAQTLERLFAICPVVDAEEGTSHETPAELVAGRYRLTGNVAGEPPYHGQLVHHGWQATRCELPTWSGNDDAAMIVEPVELELA